jgi:hypothetical protein
VSKGNELYLRGFNRSNGEKGNGETMIRGRRHLVIPTGCPWTMSSIQRPDSHVNQQFAGRVHT